MSRRDGEHKNKWALPLILSLATMSLIIVLIIVVVVLGWLWMLLNPIERTDVVGRWVSYYEQRSYKNEDKGMYSEKFQRGIHRLELRDDGTYTYEFDSFDGKERYTNSNRWEFEISDGWRQVHLAQFDFGPAKFHQKPGGYGLSVARIWNGVIINIHEDSGYYFRKETLKKP